MKIIKNHEKQIKPEYAYLRRVAIEFIAKFCEGFSLLF